MSLSSSQFGDSVTPVSPDVRPPLALSSSTMGTAQQSTAWTTKSLAGNTPLPYSAHTRSTTYNWDNEASAPNLPQSDKGMIR